MHYSDRKHILRLLEQQSEVKRIFDQFARDAGRELARFAPKADPGRVLPADVWIQNRVAEQRIEKLLLQLHDDLLANFDAHTRAAWEAANKKADAMIADFIRGLPISETARRGMFARNAHAFRSFMQRKEAGMNLSERIWKATESAKENLAYFVASGVAEGRPAALISQDIRALLLEPDRRFHRIRNARGQLVLSRPMRNYHPGAGVYRSSYMNALRVGATETNIAYHEADHERWQRLDFVLGVKVERSGTSAKPCPVCDAMQGTYPKGFKFLPWHPFCICHATPVMLSGEEFTDYLVTGHMPPGRVLRDMPQRALEYVEQHPYYRNSYSYRHNVPFFDPQAAAANTSGSGAPAKPPRPEKTAAQKEDIQRRWNTRVSTRRHAAALEAIAADFADVPSIALLGGKTAGRIAAGADPSEVDALMARLAHKIEVKKAWEERRALNKLSELLDNVPEHKAVYGLKALYKVYEAVKNKLAAWKDLPLKSQLKEMEFAANVYFGSNKYGVPMKYPYWKVARDAFAKQARIVRHKIDRQLIEEQAKHSLDFAKTAKAGVRVKQLAAELQTMLEEDAPMTAMRGKMAELNAAVDKAEGRIGKKVFASDAYTKARKDAAVWDTGDGQLADDVLIGTASKSWIKASDLQKDMICEYTSKYGDVNKPLQGRQYEYHQTRKTFERKVNAITSYIEKNPLPVDMWFSRGDDFVEVLTSRLKFAGSERVPKNLQGFVGKVIQEGGFMSAGSRRGAGFERKRVVFNIYAPRGTKGAYIEPISEFGNGAGRGWDGKTRYSDFGGEQEVLFQRGTKMRITRIYTEPDAIHGTKIYVDCEIVGQEVRDLSYVEDSLIGTK